MPDSAVLPDASRTRSRSGSRARSTSWCARSRVGPPNQVELAMYSLLWSEHCAYKHSKKLLRTLPTEGEHVVMGPGENAGAVDVGGGLVCAFKVESHNHPSAVEPFQGAATGVGGILRDIFAIGARPIAVLDSLRFGEPVGRPLALPARRGGGGHRPLRQLDRRADRRRRGLLRGALRAELPGQRDGAGAGARRAAGAQRGRRPGQRARAVRRLHRPRRDRRRLGARLGRARAEADGTRTSARPCRWAIRSRRRSCWSARWSCWSAGCSSRCRTSAPPGLTSSAAEMASKGEVGIDIDVAEVPLREPDMEPFEMMVSESQERMLCVVEPANVDGGAGAVREVGGGRRGDRHGHRHAAGCGCSTAGSSSGTCRCRALVDDCPLYDLQPAKPARAALRAARGHARRGRDAARGAARAAGLPQHRLAQAAVRAVRRDRAVAHGAPPRAGRRRGARDRSRPRAASRCRRWR